MQKNVVLNGFDSSTENIAFFEVFYQKKEVAPFKVKKCFLFLIPLWACGRPPDFLLSLVGATFSTRKVADNCPRWRHVAENPVTVPGLRRFRYIAPLYALAGANFRIE